jgi:peptidoglycan/LPS O-acetylase OafA/YrhL
MDNAFAQPMHSQHRTVPNEYGLNDYTTLENRHRRGGGDIVEETKVWIAIPIIIFFSIMPISFYDATKKSHVKAYVILAVTALAYIFLFYVMHKLKNTDDNDIESFKKISMKLIVLCILGSIIFVCNALQAQPGEADPAPGIGLMLCVFLVLIMVYRLDLLEDNGMVYALVLISIIVSLILAVCPENDGTKFAAWSLGGILFVGFCYACRTEINKVWENCKQLVK